MKHIYPPVLSGTLPRHERSPASALQAFGANPEGGRTHQPLRAGQRGGEARGADAQREQNVSAEISRDPTS